MPQLTPDCDRVVVIGVLTSDSTDFNMLDSLLLYLMMMEIRISEDYCSSDIYVFDYSNVTLGHVLKITPTIMKKYELCGYVSSTNIFCVNND
jgi:hypothetical protein